MNTNPVVSGLRNVRTVVLLTASGALAVTAFQLPQEVRTPLIVMSVFLAVLAFVSRNRLLTTILIVPAVGYLCVAYPGPRSFALAALIAGTTFLRFTGLYKVPVYRGLFIAALVGYYLWARWQ